MINRIENFVFYSNFLSCCHSFEEDSILAKYKYLAYIDRLNNHYFIIFNQNISIFPLT
jgi:hypothetical protein